jgi:hypothetical protein
VHDSDPHARLLNQGENRLIASGDAALAPALELCPRLPQLRMQSWVAGAGGGGRRLGSAPIVTAAKQEASGLRGYGEGRKAVCFIIMAQVNGSRQAGALSTSLVGSLLGSLRACWFRLRQALSCGL